MPTRNPCPVVFIVEDDASVRHSLERLMRVEGFSVRLFDSAESFLAAVVPTPHACVLLDLTLPRIDGFEVQRQLNARGIGLPVIAVSARDDDATRRTARQLGAKCLFRKPVDDRTLIDAIEWATHPDAESGSE